MTEQEHLDKIEQLSKQTNEYVIEYDSPLITQDYLMKQHLKIVELKQQQALTEAEYNARLGMRGIGAGMMAGIGYSPRFNPWGY